MTRAIVLVDGEHYPPVIRAAIADLESRGYQIAAAVFLGGREKLVGPIDLGATPVVDGGDGVDEGWHAQRRALERAIDGFAPEVALDLSDAPVVDEARRFRLAAVALAKGVSYRGADFRIDPLRRPVLCARPSVAVIGSAKRAGKTAVCGHFARILVAAGRTPVVVAMGRGGPAQPIVVRGDRTRPDVAALIEIARSGGHAASDFYEDAVMAGIATVGARRAGAGLAGTPFHDNVAAAVTAANDLAPELILLEGSGTAIPPVAADATVLVLRAGDDPARGLGLHRVLLADLIVVTMAEEPNVSPHELSALSTSLEDLAGDVVYVRTVFRPTPVAPIHGRAIFYATTAPETVKDKLVAHLESVHGARVVGVSHRLSDRDGLEADLTRAEGSYEVLVTELKAAAVDVAARRALAAGAEVIFADNLPVAVDQDLDALLTAVADRATERFETHTMGAR